MAIGIIMVAALIVGGLAWLQSHNLYASSAAARDKAQVDPSSSVVFLGDSLTAIENWNALFGVSYIANAGISGNTTYDVIYRLNPAIAYKPKKLFLMIGINDLLRGRDVAGILANYETIISRTKLLSPDTAIYIQSVLPTNNDISKIGFVDSQKIVDLNEKLKLFADGSKVFFVDLYPSFSGSDNKMYKKYTVDGVHLSYFGYMTWKNMISQYVK